MYDFRGIISRQNADIADTLQLRDVAMVTTFWLSMGYNFSCMVAIATRCLILGVSFGDKLSIACPQNPPPRIKQRVQ